MTGNSPRFGAEIYSRRRSGALRIRGLLLAAILASAGASPGNNAPEVVAATSTATATATPNGAGEALSFNLRWEETGAAGGIITGNISFPADTVANPPLFSGLSATVPGSTLVLRHGGQTFTYQDPGFVFNAVQQLDFSHEIVTQPGFSDFNVFTGDNEFTGLNPRVLGRSEDTYDLVSMTPGISGQLVATDPDPDASLTYSLDEPVTGLAINPDGSYTFAPSDPVYLSLGEGEILAVIANWTVTDNKGATASSTLTITVNGANDEPVAAPADATDPVSGQLAASDVDDNAVLTFALDTPVPGLVVSEDGSYTFDSSNPAYAALVTGESVEVIANWTVTDNGGASASSTLTITVNGFNDTPEAVATTSTATVTATPNGAGEALSFNLRWEETGAAGGIITGNISFPADTVANPPLFSGLSATVPGSTLVLRHGGQTFTYQDPGFVFNAVQQLDFSHEIVTQPGFSDFNVFTGDNEFTGLNPRVLGRSEDTYDLVSMTPGISGQLVATDPDPDASLTYSLDEPVTGLAINPDGSYTFAPSDPVYLSLGEGEILAVIANWTVTDNKGATASSTLTITVNGSAPPPLEIVNLTANITSEGFNSFTITFSSLPGRGYAAERSSDLIHWNRLRDIIGDEITTDFTDNDPILDGQSVFYRVKEISP